MAQRKIVETLASLLGCWETLFWRHCRAGLPWFWPARPAGQHAMVEARRMVRWHFGRDHRPVRRKLAQVVVTIAWPFVVLPNLWGSAPLVQTAERIAEARPKGNMDRDPPQHFAERVLRLWALAAGSQNEHR